MTSDGTYNYTYDDEGNRLTRTKISDSSLTEYTWDQGDRLTKVVERAAGAGQPITKQTDYKYDIFDRRISKSVDADGAGGGSAVVSRFVYFGDNIALQFDGASTLTHRYLHGREVDQILADEDASNEILWPLTDNLGTVRDLVDDSGAVQNHLKYDAFGKVTSESNAAVDHLFAYTGRERDEETGLQYHRARYYDPATGRFISHDPIGFAAGDFNLSRYVINNVPNRIDPTGMDAIIPEWTWVDAALPDSPGAGFWMHNLTTTYVDFFPGSNLPGYYDVPVVPLNPLAPPATTPFEEHFNNPPPSIIPQLAELLVPPASIHDLLLEPIDPVILPSTPRENGGWDIRISGLGIELSTGPVLPEDPTNVLPPPPIPWLEGLNTEQNLEEYWRRQSERWMRQMMLEWLRENIPIFPDRR